MSKWGDDISTVYFETRQGLLEGMIKMGEVSEEELKELSDKEQDFLLLQFDHNHNMDGCSFCANLDDIGLLKEMFKN